MEFHFSSLLWNLEVFWGGLINFHAIWTICAVVGLDMEVWGISVHYGVGVTHLDACLHMECLGLYPHYSTHSFSESCIYTHV